MYKKLSGAQRRKLTKDSELAHSDLLNKVPKLTKFFTKAEGITQQPVSSSSLLATPNTQDFDHECEQDFISTEVEETAETLKEETSDPLQEGTVETLNYENTTFSNDPSTWPENLTVRERDEIITRSAPSFKKSNNDYPLNSEKRHFSNDFQYRHAENGEKVKRRWLVYSCSSDSVFCFPCRLFDNNPQSSFAKKQGFKNWKKFHERASSHETSSEHFKFTQQWIEAERRINQNAVIDSELMGQIQKEAERWQNILRRIIAIIIYLAEHNLAFRGNSTKLFTKNNGNFLGLIQLLGEFDPVMMEHLRCIEESEYRVQMLSVNIQNELINCLAKQVKNNIIEKIKVSRYFSVMMDCTPDVSHKEQTSLTIRYIHEEEGIDGEIAIEESFIGYTITEESTGEALTKLLTEEVELCGLDMSNCRGQGYDNGANMAGAKKGVQSRISSEYPLAVFTPCGCHSLNLVVADGARSSVKSTLLFGIIQRIYTIFASSPKRWCVVSDHVKGITLKKVCETRWEARISSVSAVRYQYKDVLDALVDLSETVNDPTISSEAKSLQVHMEDFSFLVCLIIWHDVLFEVNMISKSLQGKSTDIALTSNLLQKTLQFIDNFRKDGLNDSVSKAKEICSEIDVEPLFKEKRQRTKKKLFDYESKSNYKATPEEEFKREVFYPLLDIMQASLKERLIQFSNHNLKWGFLYDLKQLLHAEDLKKCCENLQKHLSFRQTSDINGKELYQELLHVKTIVNEVDLTKATPLQVLKVIKKTDRKDLYTNLWIALRILLTIPISVASCERSFSKLKLIKTYLRSSMSQERLSSLAMLSIENEECKRLKLEDVIKKFASAKARKISF